MMVHLERKPGLSRCREVTTRAANHLHRAALSLEDSSRYEFFLAAYAAMRALDDLVDESFLKLDSKERSGSRSEVLKTLQRWENQVHQAAAGAYTPKKGDFEPLIFTVLDEHLSRSTLSATPFLRLSQSLRRDVEEIRLQSWDQWYDYCEGAAVAPGSVFLYLLAAREDSDGRLSLPAEFDVMDEARDLAYFCYFTHIVRDLQEDARQDPQLLTIPLELLSQAGLDQKKFRRAVSQEDPQEDPEVQVVAQRILDLAHVHGEKADLRLAVLRPRLSKGNRAVLDQLYKLYRDAFAAVQVQWRIET